MKACFLITGLNLLFSRFSKKCTSNDPNNYRGISLCDVSSKLYSSIINRRFQELIDQKDVTGEWQAGFKKELLKCRSHVYIICCHTETVFI